MSHPRMFAIAVLIVRMTRTRSICERMRVQSRFLTVPRALVQQTAI